MVEEEGKVYRENVKEMREMLSNKDIPDGYIDRFFDYLQNHKIVWSILIRIIDFPSELWVVYRLCITWFVCICWERNNR